ncbi:hypothetical protein [Aeromicrobium sp.]|uniref:hypothetical protein n=1 Tax=Aeromicrobium sp. TaxID=1871063 RepID=UPI0030C04C18
MTTPAAPATRPGRGWYAVAAVLTLVAVTIGIALATWIVRALVGYDVTPIPENRPVSIELLDRGEAIWVAPEGAAASCRSVDDQGQDSLVPGTADQVTITDGGQEWERLGIVEGSPGSQHSVTCQSAGRPVLFGHAPNPQIGRYVGVGVTGGLISGLSALGAFVIVLVVAIKRNRKPPPTYPPATYPPA